MVTDEEAIKKPTSKVTQPHDKLVKRLMSDPETAKDILTLYLPAEVKALVNLNALSLERDSFIDDEHRAFAVDLLYKTTFDNQEGYLWILLEHQRKDDPWLPVRIFKYMATIWDHIRKTNKAHHIPLIYPVILYNGDHPYSHTLTFKDMIEPEASRKLFDSFFKTPFCLIDLNIIQDDVLRNQAQDHVRGVALLMTLKHVFDKNIQIIFEQIMLESFKQLDRIGCSDELADLIYYILNECEHMQSDKFWMIINHDFSEEIGEKVMTIAEQLKASGFEEGARKEKTIIAERLLSQGVDIDLITKVTELPINILMTLKKSMVNILS